MSRIISSTPMAPGKSLLLASTRRGTPASEGNPRSECSSLVAVGICLVWRQRYVRSGGEVQAYVGGVDDIARVSTASSKNAHNGIRTAAVPVPHAPEFWLALALAWAMAAMVWWWRRGGW